jgi:hypothetical protein
MLIDIRRYVTRRGQSFKTPPAYETCYKRSVRRASGLVLSGHLGVGRFGQHNDACGE